jgi:hypothetical protein
MSVDIFVQRQDGSLRGDDIVDPLITSVPVALARGRNELDARASALQNVEVEAVYRIGVRPGQLALFLDFSTGLNWRGKITGVSYSISSGKVDAKLQVSKPTLFAD